MRRGVTQPFTRSCVAPNLRQQQHQLSRSLAVNALASSSSKHSFAAAHQRVSLPSVSISSSSSIRRSRRVIVRANWGAPVEFSPAKISSNSTVAEKLHKVVVDVGDLAGGYSKGGQFMQIKVRERCRSESCGSS